MQPCNIDSICSLWSGRQPVARPSALAFVYSESSAFGIEHLIELADGYRFEQCELGSLGPGHPGHAGRDQAEKSRAKIPQIELH